MPGHKREGRADKCGESAQSVRAMCAVCAAFVRHLCGVCAAKSAYSRLCAVFVRFLGKTRGWVRTNSKSLMTKECPKSEGGSPLHYRMPPDKSA
jgi:hypothetical protein